jgi:two-component system, NtrC family, sensor histidine kinase GlrK
MRLFRPKSFLVLVLIGFAVVALPLILALINAELFMERLARRGTAAIYRSVTIVQETRGLAEQLLALERRARQYQVLRDPALLHEVAEKHREFGASLGRLLALPLRDEQRQQLEALKEGETALYLALQEEGVDPAELDRFGILHALSRDIHEQSQRLIVTEAAAIQTSTSEARRLLLWLSVALVPLTAGFAAFFITLIAGPIQQINRGIARLGAGDFETLIEVHGPDDLRFLGQRLDWLRQRLDEAQREKTKFVSHLSHELKTPLASIREGADLLVEEAVGPLSEGQREVVGILRRNGLQLQKLIDNLLGFSRLQTQSPAFSPTVVDLPNLVQQVVTDQGPAIRKKELDLQLALNAVQLTGDSERLRIILDNLLSNAVKFAPIGGTVRISSGADPQQAWLQVDDSGSGIASEEREQVFQPFVQGRAQAIGPLRGTGLGLSIVRELVQDHGGRIEVRSSRLGGACLRVWLPRIHE